MAVRAAAERPEQHELAVWIADKAGIHQCGALQRFEDQRQFQEPLRQRIGCRQVTIGKQRQLALRRLQDPLDLFTQRLSDESRFVISDRAQGILHPTIGLCANRDDDDQEQD